ncbi:hypothetical protein Tco_0579580 [Tanacetum coccineum]
MVVSLLISMYSKCGFMDDANVVFEMTMKKDIEDAANVRTSLSALHIEETSAVMGTGGLKNLTDDVGGSKRRSISEPDSVLRRESALRIGRTSAAMVEPLKIEVLRKWATL